MKKTLIGLFLISGFLSEVQAQQDPHYTQYMYNLSVMNPAYAGSKENLSLGLLHRKQWIELEDAPTTSTFFGHSPIGKNIGLGLSLVSDAIGPVTENNIYADFSYTLKLNGNHKLAMGLKSGLAMHNVDLNSKIASTLPDPLDGAFGKDVSNSYFNFGTGAFYYTQKYYVGFSVPNMLKAKFLDFDGRSYGNEINHYFLTGGYVFDLNENIKFKPFFMIKSSFEAPASLDLSTNFMFTDKFEVGGTYRIDDSFGFMVNYAVLPILRIGYAYDHIVSNLQISTPSSHEIILLFDVNFSKKVSRSPRYF